MQHVDKLKIKVLVSALMSAHRHHAQSLVFRAVKPEETTQESIDEARIRVLVARIALDRFLEEIDVSEDIHDEPEQIRSLDGSTVT